MALGDPVGVPLYDIYAAAEYRRTHGGKNPPGTRGAPRRSEIVTGGVGNFKKATKSKPFNAERTQAFLKAKGYAIPEDGVLGPLTEAAIRDWSSGVHRRNPGKFNKVHGLIHSGPGGNASPPTKNHSQGGGQHQGGGSAGGGGGGGGGGLDPMAGLGASLSGDLKSLAKLAAQGAPIPLSRLSQLGTPADIAHSAAQLKYGSEMSGLARDVGNARSQGAQDLSDLTDWFGQIRGHLTKATADDAAASARDIAAQDEAGKSIIASLGGAANPASTDIAHEAENSGALQRMLSEAQGNYDRGVATQLGAEEASTKVRQQRTDNARVDDLLGKLRDLQGEQGAFEATTLADERQQRLGDEMNIRQFNETLRSNKFQRAAAIPGLRISAAMSGLQADQLKAGIAQTRAGTQAIKQGRSRTGSGGSTGQLTQSQLGKAIDSIIGHLRTPVTVQNPDGTKSSKGQFEGKPGQAAAYVMTTLRGYGIDPSSKAGRALALQVLSAGVKNFNPVYYNNLILGKPPKPKNKGPAGALGPIG